MNEAIMSLTERYRTSFPAKRAAVFSAFSNWRDQPGEINHLCELVSLLHKLSGSAGMYGFAKLGECARTVEALAQQWLTDRPNESQDDQDFMKTLSIGLQVMDNEFDILIRDRSPPPFIAAHVDMNQ